MNCHSIQSAFFTTKELATTLNMSASFFEKARSRNTGPSYIKIGGRVLYPEKEVTDWLSACVQRTKTSRLAGITLVGQEEE